MTEKYVPFTKEMKNTHTILVPNMLPTHFRLVMQVLEGYGYKMELLENSGPEITELYWENGEVHIKCSPADRIYCTFGIRRAGVIYRSPEAPVTSATFPIPKEAVYFRFTVVDERGRRAFSNGYFIDEMPKGE